MPQGNPVEAPSREARQGLPGEVMVESSPSRQRRPPCKTNKGMSDEAADAAALIYLLTYLLGQGVDILMLQRRPPLFHFNCKAACVRCVVELQDPFLSIWVFAINYHPWP